MTDGVDGSKLAELKAKIEEISLLLVMTSPQDAVGVGMISEMWDSLAQGGESDPSTAKLSDVWKWAKGKRDTMSIEEFFFLLQGLVSAAVQFCDGNTSVQFPHEAVGCSAGSDILAEVDETFLPEFIETHRLQLEEFETWLLGAGPETSSGEDVAALIKRYIHSLKGDAGAVKLTGIQDACHFVEDALTKHPLEALTPQLVYFREWVRSYIDALTRRAQPAQSAKDFMNRFQQVCAKLEGGAKLSKTSTAVPTPSAAPTSPAAAERYTLSGEKDIFQEFVAEAEEHLGNVESIVLEAEGSYSKEAVDTIFRGIHSLKGGSAYFTFQEMTETSHLLENLLDEVRDGKRELNAALTALVLSYIDLQKNLLASAKKALQEDGIIVRSPASVEFLRALNDFVKGGSQAGAPAAASAKPTPAAVSNPAPTAAVSEPAKSVPAAPAAADGKDAQKSDKLEVKNFVKVDTIRLDHLIDSIGEMVIYSSMLIRRCRELLPQHEDVQSISHRVEKFTRDLQDVGMSMRLVPIKGLFQKMSRLVWDTSKRIKKEVVFSMDGEDTELDRNLIDKLADPLMHMVRNALDHGVEPPDEREKLGKPRAGKVHLSATHSGGCVLIRIVDDGRGLNQEKLLAKAREKGIISESQKLTEQETYQLIFAAGFSTAAVVTDISGRGVGMDVVRRNVESLRGRIHIDSKLGEGTTFTIELPLTLAIVDGIEVLVGQERLIVPSLSIIEFVRPTREMISTTLEHGETFHFRGRYLPIFRLADLFGIEQRYTNVLDATLIVVENHDELVALMVDEIIGELSTVIKSLGALFEDIKGISGCAVMPNGDVALILDVRALVLVARAEQRRQAPKGLAENQAIC